MLLTPTEHAERHATRVKMALLVFFLLTIASCVFPPFVLAMGAYALHLAKRTSRERAEAQAAAPRIERATHNAAVAGRAAYLRSASC